MFIDDLPGSFDTHLYSQVLHDWDAPRVEHLMAASFAALPPGGWLVDHATHIDADKRGPLPVATSHTPPADAPTSSPNHSKRSNSNHDGALGFDRSASVLRRMTEFLLMTVSCCHARAACGLLIAALRFGGKPVADSRASGVWPTQSGKAVP